MYSLRSLFALTMVIAIVFGLWLMGEPSHELSRPQKIRTALLAKVPSFVAFASLLTWIREGEQTREQSRFATFAIDTVAFLGTCALMITICRLAVNVLFQ